MTLRIAATCLALAVLAGCASVPQPLQGNFAPLTAQQAVGDNHADSVRWGGRIIRTEPRSDSTCFEVISTRLDADGRPASASDDIQGRFIACRAGFYDPALFQPNREVTFTGRIDGSEARMIDGYTAQLPRIAADVVYLWPQRERVRVVTRPAPWPWYWGW
jgi:outer membrane lipoprotein